MRRPQLRKGLRLSGVMLGVLLTLAVVSPAMAQSGTDSRCAGWGLAQAIEWARENNDELKDLEPDLDTTPSLFESRLAQHGWVQSGREVCARLDLERDLYMLWRVGLILGIALLGLAMTWGGLTWMLEHVGVGQQGRSRTLMVNCFIGVMVVSAAFFVWQAMYSGAFGIFSLELGAVNPLGVPSGAE